MKKQDPVAYGVQMGVPISKDGVNDNRHGWVGVWNDQETADHIKNLQPINHNDKVVPLYSQEQIELLDKLVMDLAEIVRSSISIAERQGSTTNWEAFEKRAKDVAKRAHSYIYK